MDFTLNAKDIKNHCVTACDMGGGQDRVSLARHSGGSQDRVGMARHSGGSQDRAVITRDTGGSHNRVGEARTPSYKLRIGVMTRDVESLSSHEYRILNGIIEHPRLELALFIKDGRGQVNTLRQRLKKNLLTPRLIANILYRLQLKIESILFRQDGVTSADDAASKAKVVRIGKGIETICLHPERRRFADIFSEEDSEKVKAYGLDIILRHEFNIIRGGILGAARHGIWSFHHADNAVNRGYPPGFWEIVNDEPCCGVTLQQLTSELDGGRIIEKAWYDRHWSFYKNNCDLLDKSVVLLFKGMDKLLRQGELRTEKSPVYCNRLYTKPALRPLLKYLLSFYSNLFARAFNRLFPLTRPSCWALFFSRGDFLEAVLYRINPAPMPKGVFWADPFLFCHGKQLYVFFENFSYKTRKGIISSGKIVEDGKGGYKIADVRDAINLGYHMSYPQIIEEDGEIYMMPETLANKRLEVFRCASFPDRWELHATAFEGEEVVDTTYYCDGNGDRWLFMNKGRAPEAELYIYRISSLSLDSIEGHLLNPVIIDCKRGKNGGSMFSRDNESYRPNQIITHGVYGKGLQICRIKKLTLEEYEDEAVISIEPKFKKGLVGVHHLHQIDGAFVFDACYKRML